MQIYPYRFHHITWFWFDPEGWWSGRALFHDGHEFEPAAINRRRIKGHTHTIFFRMYDRNAFGECVLDMTNGGDVAPNVIEGMQEIIRQNYDDMPNILRDTHASIGTEDAFKAHKFIRLRFLIAEREMNGQQTHPATIALTHDYDQLEAELYDCLPELQGA
jgi:hypothetical protein